MSSEKPKAKKQPKPKLSKFIWWHKCSASGRREYRTSGWSCYQCGAVGPEGARVSDAWQLARTVLDAVQTMNASSLARQFVQSLKVTVSQPKPKRRTQR